MSFEFNLLDTLTAFENIALSLSILGTNPNEIEMRVREVASRLEILDVLKKYPYQMSGGQKQRLLIARAIISRPKILYFDEATSALDNKTQKVVSESLAKLGATRVVIAHRLSTIVNCNKIIVMERGRVVEQGSYQELYEKGGLFTQLVNRQLA